MTAAAIILGCTIGVPVAVLALCALAQILMVAGQHLGRSLMLSDGGQSLAGFVLPLAVLGAAMGCFLAWRLT